ncbi:hypothetical protein E05_27560 [Plautia stali symbiont]|nr:hypothetical protein E05_27560 [Plautia stali symbiont]
MNGKIGDAIVSTCFLRTLFEAGYGVDILAVKENESLFRHNPYIQKIYLSESFSDCHQRDKYDTAIGSDVVTLSERQCLRFIDRYGYLANRSVYAQNDC